MSFKRASSTPVRDLPPATKQLPASTALGTSTGIPSLDDVLGGGLPLSHILTLLCPDLYSSYGDLIQKYFIAQGVISEHTVITIDPSGDDLTQTCMWIRAPATGNISVDASETINDAVDYDEERDPQGTTPSSVKIAWRYQNMKEFQTTVSSTRNQDNYCRPFELTSVVPKAVLDSTRSSQRLLSCSARTNHGSSVLTDSLRFLETTLLDHQQQRSRSHMPIRISIRNLASLDYGTCSIEQILRYLQQLKSLLRRFTNACALITLAPVFSKECREAGEIGLKMIASLSDGCMSFLSHTGDPVAQELFPNYHGLLQLHSLPSPQTLIPPSDAYSQLRGLRGSAIGGSGENNICFKCTRKRLVIETLHLDVDGGVTVRRTHPPPMDPQTMQPSHRASLPMVQLQLDADMAQSTAKEAVSDGDSLSHQQSVTRKKGSSGKTVMFHADKPELYEF